MSRRKARDITFKYVYSTLYGESEIDDTIESIITADSESIEALDGEERIYFDKVTLGIKENEKEIDQMILSKLKNWTIERIFKIDLAILRLAVYEIIYFPEMPIKVAVNEAVELAKKYGNDSSSNFVNGVLREIIKDKEN